MQSNLTATAVTAIHRNVHGRDGKSTGMCSFAAGSSQTGTWTLMSSAPVQARLKSSFTTFLLKRFMYCLAGVTGNGVTPEHE